MELAAVCLRRRQKAVVIAGDVYVCAQKNAGVVDSGKVGGIRTRDVKDREGSTAVEKCLRACSGLFAFPGRAEPSHGVVVVIECLDKGIDGVRWVHRGENSPD